MDYAFHFGVIAENWPLLLHAAGRTVVISAQAMAFGLAIGVTGAAIKTLPGPAAALLRWPVSVFVEVLRNTPLLAQLFLIFFGLPRLGIRLTPDTAAVLGLSLNCGAYTIEIVRAGILAVPHGLVEAGLSLGLSRWLVFRHIVLVPALRTVYPSLTSQFLIVLLSSSVVSSISAVELTATAAVLQMSTFRAFEVYAAVTLIYLALSLAFSAAFALFARLLLGGTEPAR